jgi:hypothetical protein
MSRKVLATASAALPAILGPKGDVLLHGLPREERVLLEHHPAVRSRARNELAVDADFAAIRRDVAGDGVEQG